MPDVPADADTPEVKQSIKQTPPKLLIDNDSPEKAKSSLAKSDALRHGAVPRSGSIPLSYRNSSGQIRKWWLEKSVSVVRDKSRRKIADIGIAHVPG